MVTVTETDANLNHFEFDWKSFRNIRFSFPESSQTLAGTQLTVPEHPEGVFLDHRHFPWVLSCPTFLSVRNSRVFVVHDLLTAD